VILVDTSIWVDHFRRGNSALREALEEGVVASHAFVIGELACGNLRSRREILDLLGQLPLLQVAEDREIHHVLETHRLMGHGLGWVDVHLLGAARLGDAELWTLDRALFEAAQRIGLRLVR
jgi:predicted nucleic acid-binding protein